MATNGVKEYSVPEEARLLLERGIISNPLVAKNLPSGSLEASRAVSFEGSAAPSIPINWRFAESISSLKGLEATVLNVLLQRKYGIEPVKVNINTYGQSPDRDAPRQMFLVNHLSLVTMPRSSSCPP